MLSEAQIQARIEHLLDQERAGPEHLYWLSFADDDGFRGACIVRAQGVTTATTLTHILGINPGGEVLCVQLPSDSDPQAIANLNRLMTSQDELTRLFGACASADEIEAAAKVNA